MSAPRHSAARRATRGFTLVELLVVIVVIGILAALITPAYFSVRRSVFEAGIAQDQAQLAGALHQFKSDYGFYPSDFSEFVDANGDPLAFDALIPNGGGATVESRLLAMLQKIAPNHNENSSDPTHPSESRLEHWWEEVGSVMIVDPSAPGPATKDNRLRGPEHALWFWLTQLYNDAQYPLSGQRDPSDPNVIVSERKVYFDFPAEMLRRRPLVVNYPDAPVEYYLYSAIQRGGDAPLVYFHNDTYVENTTNDLSIATVINYEPLVVDPDALNIAKPVRVPGSLRPEGLFMEPESFQIVTAGNDEKFGEVDLGTYGALDNICNFAEGRLDGFVTRYVDP